MRKEYSSPEWNLVKLQFENLLDTVKDSRPEDSGWDGDDEREE